MAKLISIFLQLSLQAVSEGSFSGWFYRLSLKTFSAICLCRLSLKAVSAGCLYRLFVQVVSAGFFSGYPCKLPLKALRAIVSSVSSTPIILSIRVSSLNFNKLYHTFITN